MTPERVRELLFVAGFAAFGWGIYSMAGLEWLAIGAGGMLMGVAIVGALRA